MRAAEAKTNYRLMRHVLRQENWRHSNQFMHFTGPEGHEEGTFAGAAAIASGADPATAPLPQDQTFHQLRNRWFSHPAFGEDPNRPGRFTLNLGGELALCCSQIQGNRQAALLFEEGGQPASRTLEMAPAGAQKVLLHFIDHPPGPQSFETASRALEDQGSKAQNERDPKFDSWMQRGAEHLGLSGPEAMTAADRLPRNKADSLAVLDALESRLMEQNRGVAPGRNLTPLSPNDVEATALAALGIENPKPQPSYNQGVGL